MSSTGNEGIAARARRSLAPWSFAIFAVLVVVVFHKVVLPFVLALMLAYVLAPMVARLARVTVGRRTIPRWLAVIICYLGIIGALGLFIGAFVPRLSGDFARLFHEAPQFFAKVKTRYVPALSTWMEENFPSDEDEARVEGPRPERKITITPSPSSDGKYDVSLEGLELQVEQVGKSKMLIGPHRESEGTGRVQELMTRLARAGESETMDLLKLGQAFVTGVVLFVARFILVLMLTAFLLVDSERLLGFLRSLVPSPQRSDFDVILSDIDRGLSGVIRGQFLICLVNGSLTYVGLLVFRVKYPLLLGMLAGGMSLIPVFGSILSSIPIVAVALVSAPAGQGFSLSRGLLVLGWIIGIHLLEANYLNPRIIGTSAKIHPVLVVFALLVGETMYGLVGALVAVPVASMVTSIFQFLRRRAESES